MTRATRRHHRHRPLAAALALAFAAAPWAATTASAGSTPVPSQFRDVANCNDAGSGSFRQAMGTALTGDIVDLRDLPCSRITLTTGEVTTSAQNLIIYGPGVEHLYIDGHSASRVIHHTGFQTISIYNLHFGNGKYERSGAASGGCIASSGSIVLTNSVVSGCVAESDNGDARGGAVYATSLVALQESIVSAGIADAANGEARGGGVYAGTQFTAQDSTVDGSAAAGDSSVGGGAFSLGNIHLDRATISNNQADLAGGLMSNFGGGGSGTAQIYNATISHNSAAVVGGVFARATLLMTASTVTMNTETSQHGAGVYAGAGVRLIDSIIAGNTANGSPCDFGGGPGTGIAPSSAKNIIVLSLVPNVPSDTMSTDPLLGPLQDNGGRTRTHAPATNSPAINHGSADGSHWDARGTGFARVVGSAQDIGSFERNGDVIFVNGFN